MNRGYVKVWRKIQDSDILKNHKYCTFFLWCLTKASHKRVTVIVGYQPVALEPGQFIFGRRMAAIELGMTEREIRTCLQISKKSNFATIKTTNKFSIITIINWPTYQGQETDARPAKRPTGDQQATTNKNVKNVKKKDPDFFSSRFSALRDQYPSDFQKNIDEILAAISSTRKRGKITDSVKLQILEGWRRFPSEQVMAGCRIYLEKAYHREGKDEKYLLGIIRKQKDQTGEKPSPETPPPDSRKLPLLNCPSCKRTVLSSDMKGPVCILCSEVKSNA